MTIDHMTHPTTTTTRKTDILEQAVTAPVAQAAAITTIAIAGGATDNTDRAARWFFANHIRQNIALELSLSKKFIGPAAVANSWFAQSWCVAVRRIMYRTVGWNASRIATVREAREFNISKP